MDKPEPVFVTEKGVKVDNMMVEIFNNDIKHLDLKNVQEGTAMIR